MKLIPITYKLDMSYVYLTFDCNYTLSTLYKEPIKDRVCSIDLNPNYIGYTICDWKENYPKKIITSGVFSIKDLNDKDNKLKGLGLSSESIERKYLTNKRHHELIDISYKLIKMSSYYRCESFAIEDLSINSSDRNKGKRLNKLCNNQWCRNLVTRIITKLCPVYNIQLLKVIANYSSYTGNICYRQYKLPDMCLSALEIGRRGYEFSHQYLLKDKSEQRNIIFNNSTEFLKQAKQSLEELGLFEFKNLGCLREIFEKIKNSKINYRVLLEEIQCNFRKFYSKRSVYFYEY